jgi:hypothetical protein
VNYRGTDWNLLDIAKRESGRTQDVPLSVSASSRTAGGEDQDSAILYLRQQEPCEQIMCEMIDAESALKTLLCSGAHVITLHTRIQNQRVDLCGVQCGGEGVDCIEVVEIERPHFGSFHRYEIARAADDPTASPGESFGCDLANARAYTCHHYDLHRSGQFLHREQLLAANGRQSEIRLIGDTSRNGRVEM